jgi:hypothetical protein
MLTRTPENESVRAMRECARAIAQVAGVEQDRRNWRRAHALTMHKTKTIKGKIP